MIQPIEWMFTCHGCPACYEKWRPEYVAGLKRIDVIKEPNT